MILVFIVPVVVALSLCLLPPGRQAVIGIGITAVFLILLWFVTGANADGGLTSAYVVMAAPGVALAALAHLTYHFLGPRLPVWGYAIVAVVLLFVTSAILRALAGT